MIIIQWVVIRMLQRQAHGLHLLSVNQETIAKLVKRSA
jgi:hypothetical protein